MTGRTAISGILMCGAVLAGCGTSNDQVVQVPSTVSTVDHADDLLALRDPDVPDLPFDDNPDPDQCGIPIRWGLDDPAWLTGTWEGELIEPVVLLYDSHSRLSITGRLDHGSEVLIVLFQENPVLDFYLVRSTDGSEEGWVPAPFVSFDPVLEPAQA
jgi:hypothetical protein